MTAAPLPPNDLVAEEHVLGAMMVSARAIEAVRRILDPADFFRPSHGRIFTAAVELHESGSPVDPIILAARLEADQLLGDSVEERRERIRELATLVPVASNAVHHARIVRVYALRRALIEELEPVMSALWSGGLDLAEALAAIGRARELLERIGDDGGP